MRVDGIDIQIILEQIKIIAIEAGKKILEIYNSTEEFHIETKTDFNHSSPLTIADLAANDIIVDFIKKLYPTHAILSEESEDTLNRLTAQYVWIIDPLDGTKDFLKHTGDFTVNIALVHKNKPILGVVYVAVKDELFFATNGNGAYVVTGESAARQIHVSTRFVVSEMILLKSRSHAKPNFTKFIEKHSFKEVQKYGSSLKGCIIADGKADVYCRFGPTNEWDICAIHCILEEAGGVMTLLTGEKLSYNNENTLNNGFIISNGKIHERLIEWCKKIV